MRLYSFAVIFIIVLLLGGNDAGATESRIIKLASTTSTDNSGLYDYLLPQFTEQTGFTVHVIAMGTGRAINIASRGDVDVLLVHDKKSELEFVKARHGIERHTFMYNDYILVGPVFDPAQIAQMPSIIQSMKAIYQHQARFISRGDDSGTHKKELMLWQQADIEHSNKREWYIEIGGGMGQALNMANQRGAYTLSDRSTWVSFNNRDNLRLLVENDPLMKNPYSIILVNPEKHPRVNYQGAKIFADWITSAAVLQLIAAFRVSGVQLFKIYD